MVIKAQQIAREGINDQPTAIVYRTVKGWKYGIEGRKSHGGGHKFCSEGYYQSLKEFEDTFNVTLPRLENQKTPAELEQLYYDTLMTMRRVAESEKAMTGYIGRKVAESKQRLDKLNRQPKPNGSDLNVLYNNPEI